MNLRITFSLGQTVYWPAAPKKIAQVVELRRSSVRIFYCCRSGTERQPVVKAAELQKLQAPSEPPLPLHNPFGRAIVRRKAKAFDIKELQ